MKHNSSRRDFLAAGLVLPVGAKALTSRPNTESLLTSGMVSPQNGLDYRVLGKTGLKVTTVGFGCMITSDPSVIEKAADLGINYFDTARVYQNGNNERMVGAALKSRRSQIVLSSKSGAETRKEAMDTLETSLRELGTDHLDIWYLHGKSKPSQITDEWLEAVRQAKKDGKIRFAGVSTHGGHADIAPGMIAHKDDIDVWLIAYNFTMDPSMKEVVQSVKDAGLGIVAMKVMAGGFRRIKASDPLHEKLSRPGALLAALKWVLNNPNVDTTIPSMVDMAQLDENMKAMNSKFGEPDKKLLASQLDMIGPLYCRMCGDCEGLCPKGLPVSDMLRYLSYAEGYGDFRLGRENFLSLPKEVQEVRCNLCPTCSIQCPNGVKVGDRLRRAQEMFA